MKVNLKFMLENIADSLDEHINLGQPYDLTFFHDEKVPLTKEQKDILAKYLAYHFRNIWGNSWIKMEASKLREIADCIEYKQINSLDINIDKLQNKEHMGYELNR